MIAAPVRRAARISTASARLGMLYAVGVFSLLCLLGTWTGEWGGAAAVIISAYAGQAVVLAAILVLLFAVARQFGYVLLWLLYLFAWIAWPWTQWTDVGVLAGFVFWSVAALPLYLIGWLGFTDPLAKRGAGRIGPAVVLCAWILLLIVTLAVTPPLHLFIASAITGHFGDPPSFVLRFARVIWGPVPVLISVHAIARWRVAMMATRRG